MTDEPFNLDRFKVSKSPETVYYIPQFISKEEEDSLLNHVYAAPRPKWVQLSNRRLQYWGGLPHKKGVIAEDLPQWLKVYAQKIADLGIFGDKVPNHVLVNEYEAGQGIMPHEDGPLYLPIVSTISLGSHTLLDFYHPITSDQVDEENQEATSFEDRFICSILLEPRSLVLVCDDMYKVNLHGIAERTSDLITDKIANLEACEPVSEEQELQRTKRVSLTIRHIPKMIKAKFLFGKR